MTPTDLDLVREVADDFRLANEKRSAIRALLAAEQETASLRAALTAAGPALARIAARAKRMEAAFPGSADDRQFDFGLTFGDVCALAALAEAAS